MPYARAAVLIVVSLAASPVAAQDSVQGIDGAGQYRTYCAVCHGDDATGSGPLAATLKTRPADLTLIARRNDGTYPAELVFRIIDGRKPVKGHGGPDMPVWGDAFARSAQDSSPEAVRARIDALVRYLERLQKP